MKDQNHGTLYGVGVGPGDPELIPLKSIKVLNRVDVIFAAASTKNDHSRAVDIARPFIPCSARVELLSFPMSKDKQITKAAWERHARTILSTLKRGQNAAFLTLGDPLTYATYGYLLKTLRALAPDAPVVTVPGITSFQAAAARMNLPLVEGEESLLVVSGVEGGRQIRELSAVAENIVILKAYKNIKDITSALEETGRIGSSIGISNCSRDNEEVIPDVRRLNDMDPGYWTLIIAKNG